MLHSVIYNYKINKDLEKSRQGKEIETNYSLFIEMKKSFTKIFNNAEKHFFIKCFLF